jgi:CRISPR type III-A-associated RAMP protein Csm5
MKLERGEKNIIDSYNEFAAMTNVKPTRVDNKKDVPDGFKKKSIQYFLDNFDLLRGDKKTHIERMAKGVTTLRSAGVKKFFIQNGCNEPVIPGSSFKGAVRNAILWKLLSDDPGVKMVFKQYVAANLKTAEKGGNQKEFAGKFSEIENVYGKSLNAITFSRLYPEFTGTPATYGSQYVHDYNERWKNASEIHRDLFRIVRIGDAKIVPRAFWKEITVKTYNFNGFGFSQRTGQSILEALGKATKARFRLTIDKELAKEIFAGNIPPYLNSIDALLQTVNEFFTAVASSELAFYGKAATADGTTDVKQWYADLLKAPTGEDVEKSALFRLGWGGGMMSKTQFLDHIDEPDRARIRNLTNYRPTTIAPQSRCLQADDSRAICPLGWCKLRYLGKNEAEAVAKLQLLAPTPAGCVRATIIDDRKPVQIRVEEGENKDATVIMPGVTLSGFGLKNGSTVFVRLEIKKGRLEKAEYKGKP